MMVTVFGGSQYKEGSDAYGEAQALGNLLAIRGDTVLTGGYIGAMEAVSRGAAEAGGVVIGVTCIEIERWRDIRLNRWVSEEWKKPTLIERLQSLIEGCDAAIALPGGPGTLTEISMIWNLMIVDALPPKPLILIGNGWLSVFEDLFQKLGDFIPKSQRTLLRFSPDIYAAVKMLDSIA